MDNITLKKKLSTYKSDKGYLKNVSDDVLYEVLVAWENWTGSRTFLRSRNRPWQSGQIVRSIL